MNRKGIDAIANALLYEGYMLYPYRPSAVKNRQRFNFGVLYPPSYCAAQSGSDACSAQAECLVERAPARESAPAVEVRVRFLKLVTRNLVFRNLVTQATHSQAEKGSAPAASCWQEAIECEVSAPRCGLDALAEEPLALPFGFPGSREGEGLGGEDPPPRGEVVRSQEPVEGILEISAEAKTDDLFRLRVRVENRTRFEGGEGSREQALARSLVSAHILLGVADGGFVSLLDPPESLKDLAAGCQNVGVWPVLVGAEGARDTMLASPIILYDYPRIAPESPGDLFDGAEIDEILALRILTMTDDEKHEMRQADERSRKILERTERLPTEHLMRLHGTLRELRPFKEEAP
jgi:hydrogenase maturation protease